MPRRRVLLAGGLAALFGAAPAFLQAAAGALGAGARVATEGRLQASAADRRSLIGAALTAAAGAGAENAWAAAEPKVTSQCEFMLRIGQDKSKPLRRVVIDIFGEEAPRLSKTFMQACTATYPGKGGISARYAQSTMSSVSKDRMIGFANFPGGNFLIKPEARRASSVTSDMKIPLAGPDTLTQEANSLRHDRLGRVSMSKGGGSFNFAISPVENAPWLDSAEYDRVVIGQVSEGLDVIAELNRIKAVRRGDSLFTKGIGEQGQIVTDFTLQPLEKTTIVSSVELGPEGAPVVATNVRGRIPL